MSPRPTLVALPGYADRPEPDVLFCSHCGSAAPDGVVPLTRVCGECGTGTLVGASPSLAPAAGDAFLLVDGRLAVAAMSPAAERLLGLSGQDAAGMTVTEVLMPADCEVGGAENLAGVLVRAARGEVEGEGAGERLVVRPSREFGIRFWARVGPCGPPRGALVVLADGQR